jgi:glycosyltransferase involved in cell wall biosynthesis
MDNVIFVSEGLRRLYIERRFSDLSTRSAAVYNLPPPSEPRALTPEDLRASFGLPDGRPLVVYAGKLSLGKGIDILFEAIPRVVRQVPQALFVLVGPSNPAVSFPGSLQEELRPEGNLFHIPRLPHSKLLDLLSISDVVVSPSTWPEPLSRVLLEAMSLSKPVVGTRVGGTSETIEDEVTGFLVEREDPKALGNRISDLLQDPIRAAEMGRAGYTLLGERFSPERILPRLLSIYRGEIPQGGLWHPAPLTEGRSFSDLTD